MSRIFHSVIPLPPPFATIDEREVSIPVGQQLVMAKNPSLKVLIFLEADLVHRLDEGPPQRIRSGDVLVVRPGARQVYWPATEGREGRFWIFRVVFTPGWPWAGEAATATVASGDEELDFARFVRAHFAETRHIPNGAAVTREALARMRAEAEERQAGHRHRVHARCVDLVVALARLIRTNDEGRPAAPLLSREQEIARLAVEFMQEYLDQPLTLDGIAWRQKISEVHLARVFKKVTGRTIFEHLGWLRIERAKELLLGGDLSAAEVARRTGFSSPTLFGRQFRRATGLTPLEFRRRLSGSFEHYSSPRLASNGKRAASK